MPNEKVYDVGIVIVNWRCKEKILKCLESVRKAGFIENVVVVDNGSDDDSLLIIKKSFSQIQTIELRKNLGFSGGCNEGIKFHLSHGAKYIFVLNPDTEINGRTIGNLVEAMEKDKSIGIAGPKIYDSGKKLWSCGGVIDKFRYSGGLIGLGEKDAGQYDKEKEVDYISGTAMMIRLSVFEKIGLLPEGYFLYYEDVEFCHKTHESGFKLMFIPASTLIHHESSSTGKNSPSQEYYMARNHLLFVERKAPFFIKIRELIRLPKTIYEHWQKGERWAIKGIKDYFARKFKNQVISDSSTSEESIWTPSKVS